MGRSEMTVRMNAKVAQESADFSPNFIRPSEDKSLVLASSSFPNLGSSDLSLVTEDFTSETPARINFEELLFPAMERREERRFWQECSLDDGESQCEIRFTARACTPGVCSLSDMYSRAAGSKWSSLFSSDNTEEVVFPKRKNRVNRNVWGDTTNAGSADYDIAQDHFVKSRMGKSFHSTASEVQRSFSARETSDASGVGGMSRSPKSGSDGKNSGMSSSYPPPLRSLSRRESRVPHNEPWVELQRIRIEGRFVLQEVEVSQPMVFHPIRKEGRLVLQLTG